MKVILTENIKNIGKKGDIKDVSDGYARNFLFPKNLAHPATAENIQEAQKIKEELLEQNKREIEKTKQMIAQIENRNIIIKRREKNKKLFGSITAKDIATELKTNYPEISEKMIILPKPIRNLGEYKVELEFNHGLKAYFILNVEGE